MSRLLRDATATSKRNQELTTAANATNTSAANKPPSPASRLDPFADFPDEPKADPRPPKKQQVFDDMSPVRNTGFDENRMADSSFDAKTFVKDVLAGNIGLSISHAVPEDINSFAEYDRFCRDNLPDLKLDLRIEAERLSQELAQAFSDLRRIEHQAETAVALDKEKAIVVSLLYDRRDLQNKTAILTEKKTHTLNCHELLVQFEMFADLSRDIHAFQRVANGFANDQKVYFPDNDPEPDLQLSLAYSQLFIATREFKLDRAPLHDYEIVDLPGEDWAGVRTYIEQEYRLVRARQGK